MNESSAQQQHDAVPSPLLQHQQFQHLVVPGQVIAVSDDSSSATTNYSSQDYKNASSSSFLRGHGTFIETTTTRDNIQQQRLIAAVTGIVQRVNKLISVEPTAGANTLYQPAVGDLIVGRIMTVGATRWNVLLTAYTRLAALPLSGVHLPDGIQRIRTAQDARDMRLYLQPGDLISAEIHKVAQTADNSGTVFLHTRSIRYGKLEQGCVVQVPPMLVPRRKTHWTSLVVAVVGDGNNNDSEEEERVEVEVLLGCNGMIWMQRKLLPTSSSSAAIVSLNESTTTTTTHHHAPSAELAEFQEQRQAQHVATPYSLAERHAVARVRNCIECLRQTISQITAESLQQVYEASIGMAVADMLLPENVIRLTASQRPSSS